MSFVSRGFRGRRRETEADPTRVPPGQYVTEDFPVLSAGPTPQTSLDEWTFSIVSGDEKKEWSWEEFRALPSEEITADIHCVTRWSKLDTNWEGVSIDTLLEHVESEAGMTRVQQLEQRLRQHRVADPRRRDYQDLVHVKRMLAGIGIRAAISMPRRVLSFEF